MVITTAQLHSTKPELRFCTRSNPARGVSEIRDGEDHWQWSRLKIKLKRLSLVNHTTKKQFIIHRFIITSKREISRRNWRTGAVLSKREPTIQNGLVGTNAETKFYLEMKFCTDTDFYETFCFKINWNLDRTLLKNNFRSTSSGPPTHFFSLKLLYDFLLLQSGILK